VKALRGLVLASSALLFGVASGGPADPSQLPLVLPSPRFQRFSTDNGLPQNSVRTVLQTPDGFLWATTFDGLVRFDGVAFRVWNAGNTPGLSGNRFVTLYADADNSLWIGDEGRRIFHLKDGRAEVWDTSAQLTGAPLVRRHRSGRLLAFDGGGRVVELGASGAKPVSDLPLAGALASGRPSPALGVAMLGSRSAIVFEDGELREVPLPPETLAGQHASASAVFSLSPSADGGLYVIAWNGSVHRYARGRWEALPSLEELTGGALTVPTLAAGAADPEGWPMLRDGGGRLWLAIPRQGLFRRDPSGRRFRYGARDGFSLAWDRPCLLEDARGGIWVGTDAGLLRFKGDLITPLSTFEGLPSDNVNAVLEARDGTIWAAASGGGPLARITPAGIERVDHPGLDGVATIQTALFEDSKGRVTIATGSSRLFRYEGGRYQEITGSGPFDGMVVNAMTEEPDGTMWFGGEGKLVCRRTDGSWRTFTAADGLPSVRVKALELARGGGLWIGTWGGLALWKDGRLTGYRERDGLSSDHIRSLHQDEDGTLWIGTYDRGLTRFKDGRFARITASEGLPSNGVFAILPDGFGRFWMSSNVGISRVTRSELNACADGRAARVRAVLYTREDGMLSSECNGGRQPAGFRMRDGRLLFGTQGGIVVIDPAAQPPSREPERVFVEAVLSRGVPRPLAAPLRIPPGEDELEIRYSAPAFVKPELVRFEYRLAGLAQEWTDAGNRRSAYFSYVPPGRYAFEVRATSVDGVTGGTPAHVELEVLAPWWNTVPARVSAAILFLAAAALGVRLRLQALRRRGRELEALVTARTRQLEDAVSRLTESERAARAAREEALQASQAKSVFLAAMSHELRTPLNAVLGFAQLMDRETERSAGDRESLGIIRRSGEHLLGLINDVLSLAKIEAGKTVLEEQPFGLHRLVDAVKDMTSVRASSKGLRLERVIGGGVPAFALGDEGKLRQVLLNLLGNAVKFTERGTVTLSVSGGDGREGRVRFEVSDTGVGISEPELRGLFGMFVQTASGRKAAEGTGLGLAISRDLVRLMGGEIEVRSAPGRGSTFAFEVRLPECGAPVEAPARGAVTRLAAGQGVLRVLVVDDVAENRRLLGRLLSSVGFEIAEAADHDAALLAFQTLRPHAAFVDVRLAGRDGRELTRRVRQEDGGERGRCAIVGISASVAAEDRQAFSEAGGDAFLGKPFREEEVFEVLERLLGVAFERREEKAAVHPPGHPPVSLALPLDVLESLEAALADGDLERAKSIAEEARPAHPQGAAAVTELLGRFEIGRLLALVEASRSAGSSAP